MANVWWCPIDLNRGNSSYAELKARCVVAQGWSRTGDLSALGDRAYGKLETLFDKEVASTISNLFLVEPGDLVVGLEGTVVRGICEILPQTSYLYDRDDDVEGTLEVGQSAFDYANCLYPVRWVDWDDFEPHWRPAPSPRGFRGVKHLTTDAHRIEERWNGYKEVHDDVPCTREWLDRRLAKRREREARVLSRKEGALFEVAPQIILSGPPGTGKTYAALRMAARKLGLDGDAVGFEERRFAHHRQGDGGGWWDIVQFHPAYNYEDFVRGIACRTDGSSIEYRAEDRIFARMCKAASRSPADEDGREPPYVLIVDEINRANLPAVLGELLYALEYRGQGVATPHAVDGDATLLVPKNLFVIGTMNTSDRSVGHLDYAVRRRFGFVMCAPDETKIRYEDANLQRAAREAFATVAKLFEGRHLSPDYSQEDVQVGHTYFMNAASRNALRLRVEHQVVPLLREYLADGVLVSAATEADGPEACIKRLLALPS